MKVVASILVLVFAVASVQHVSAQIQKPVTWKFSAKKLSATSYEVHMSAALNDGWHIYSQTTPDGGPVATSIAFNKNPLIIPKGKITEVGHLHTAYEPMFGVDVKQYESAADFVQVITLKASVKTTISGEIEFMACNSKQCLPPSKQTFSIALQ